MTEPFGISAARSGGGRRTPRRRRLPRRLRSARRALRAPDDTAGGRPLRDGGRYLGYWAVSCSVTTHAKGGWTGSRQTPSFFLDEDVQLIVSGEQAVRIARDVVDPLGVLADEDVHLTAVRI